MNIGPLAIGGANPCRIICELSNNHNGSVATALRLTDACIDAGADAIKLQTYTADELVALRGDGPAPAQWGANGWTMRTLYEQAATSVEILEAVVARCQERGVPWFSSVFGLESLARLERMGCPAYKIARLDAHHVDLIAAAKATGKPVLVSSAEEPTRYNGVEYLYCPPGYPTRPEDITLPLFTEDWQEMCSGPFFLGLSSHCLAPELPVAAVARGAKLLEYHVQLEEEPSVLEANISLTQHQLRAMIASVRMTEQLLG